MPVNYMTDGSGDRYDYKPNIEKPFDKQVPQDTSSSKNYNPAVTFGNQPTGNREGDASPDVPTCGSPDDSAV